MKINKNFSNRAKIPIPDSCKRKVNIIINRHPLLDVGANIVTKGEDEVLNVIFVSLFRSKTSCSLGGQPPLTWKTVMGSRMKPPLCKGKWSVTHCCYLVETA